MSNRPIAVLPSLLISLLLVGVLADPSFAQPPTGSIQAPEAEAEAQAQAPWLLGPFAATAEALLAATADVVPPDGAPAVMLRQDASYTFDRQGRVAFRRHWVYKVSDPQAFQEWSKTEVRWSPWSEERPEIRARVILPDGRERWLDTTALEESRATEGREGLYGDRRRVTAFLPSLEPGSVVEEEVRLRTHTAAFPAGTVHRHYVAFFIPSLDGRLVLEAPTNLALRYGARRVSAPKPAPEVADGKVRVVFEFGPLPAVDAAEEGAPGHRPRFPHVAFSTGRDWRQVARELSRRVDASVASASLEALRADMPPAGVDARRRVNLLLDMFRRRLRHNGLDLEATADFPADPDQILQDGVGDGLDLAVALVAALRRAGVDSDLALVNAGFGADVEPQLPGLGLFNHAMVRVSLPPEEGADQGGGRGNPGGLETWVDPSAPFTRVGELPLASQGRFALIADPRTDGLVRLPVSHPEDNLAIEEREVFFADFGPGRLVERCEYYGSAGRTQRRITATLESDHRRRGYQAYAHAFHHAAALGDLEEGDPYDLSGPFHLRLEALDSNRVRTELDTAVLEIPVRELARRLPPIVLEAEDDGRHEEFIFPEPFASEWQYVVRPPPGFVLEAMPEDLDVELGPAVFRQRFRKDGGLIRARLRFDVRQRLITAHQFGELVRNVKRFLERPSVELRFVLGAVDDLEAGRLQEALDDLRDAARREPGRPGHRVRLSQMLPGFGLVEEAERQARQAIALAPRWGLAHWALGIVLEHDALGRRFAPGADLEGARKALDEAARLAPAEPRIRADVARLLERDSRGRLHEEGAELDAAVEVYRRWRREFESPDLDPELLRLLRATGRWSEILAVIEEAAEVGPVPPISAQSTDALALAATSKTQGLPEALRQETSAVARQAAARQLIAGREYSLAAEMLASSGSSGGLGALLGRARRFEEVELHPDDPRTPLMGLLALLRHPHPERQELAAYLHPRQLETYGTDAATGPGTEPAVAGRVLEPYRRLLEGLSPNLPGSQNPDDLLSILPWKARIDLALANLDPTLNGAPHLGYRITLGAQGTNGSSGQPGSRGPTRLFVTKHGEGLRLVGSQGERALLGLEILDRLDRGDLPGALQWLEWVADSPAGASIGASIGASSGAPSGASSASPGSPPEGSADPLDLDPFTLLWPSATKAAPSRARASIAGAALAASVDRDGRALARLRAANPAALGDSPTSKTGLALEVATLRALEAAGELLELETTASQLADRYPASGIAFGARLRALAGLGDWRNLVTAAETRLEARPGDPEALRALIQRVLLGGNVPATRAPLEQLRQGGTAAPIDASRWLLVRLIGGPTPEEIGVLLEVGDPIGGQHPAWQRARSAALAEVGDQEGALASLRKAVPPGTEPAQQDAYLMGRLAEAAGLTASARDLYLRLLSDRDAQAKAPLYRYLAERRMQGLLANAGGEP